MVDESVRLISSVMYMNVVVPNYILFRMFAIQLLYHYNFWFSLDSVNLGCRVGSRMKVKAGKGYTCSDKYHLKLGKTISLLLKMPVLFYTEEWVFFCFNFKGHSITLFSSNS